MTPQKSGLGQHFQFHIFTGIKPKGLIAQDGHGACVELARFHAESKRPNQGCFQ